VGSEGFVLGYRMADLPGWDSPLGPLDQRLERSCNTFRVITQVRDTLWWEELDSSDQLDVGFQFQERAVGDLEETYELTGRSSAESLGDIRRNRLR
jgi:hypothetical protein